MSIELHETRCAICNTTGNATELYPATLSPDDLNPQAFSARRLPDRIHYRMVRCNKCGLVRSDPIADPSLIATLYERSVMTYGGELDCLRATYGRYLRELEPFGVNKSHLMEIGCGNGFLLQEALSQGYAQVTGIEPSSDAIAKADVSVRASIKQGLMLPGVFAPESFDVVCIFHVFDHLLDPAELLRECHRVLKPGGLMLCLNHNVEAVSAKLMRERSPIIDIEHTYLYSPRTMRVIFEQAGFAVRRVDSVINRYELRYLTHLLPLPSAIKQPALNWLNRTSVGSVQMSVPLGNLYLIAQK
jgi:SAM-dependent methyltransferase